MPLSDQGISEDRYSIIPRVLIFIFSADKVLLLKGPSNKKLWAGLYNGLGGHVERGEDILTAARRELEEESNLIDIPLNLCGTIIIDTSPSKGVGIFVFRGEYLRGNLLDSSEGQLKWVNFNALESVPLVEDLKTILPLVRDWRPGLPPFSAGYHYDLDDRLVVTFAGNSI